MAPLTPASTRKPTLSGWRVASSSRALHTSWATPGSAACCATARSMASTPSLSTTRAWLAWSRIRSRSAAQARSWTLGCSSFDLMAWTTTSTPSSTPIWNATCPLRPSLEWAWARLRRAQHPTSCSLGSSRKAGMDMDLSTALPPPAPATLAWPSALEAAFAKKRRAASCSDSHRAPPCSSMARSTSSTAPAARRPCSPSACSWHRRTQPASRTSPAWLLDIAVST
mmetsp:Transcript_103047/g.280010  ORF Transcript_103047/g.280010 Transcript_103047/m.280010 type:complete len:226 (+) Transcript_103047:224-901(+)